MADLELKWFNHLLEGKDFFPIPDVTWEDVGGLNSLRKEFDRYIVQRIKFPEHYKELGVKLEYGILLYGPPGCGKTLIAKAVANDAGASFIHIEAAELLNKYVGESELAVRTIFSRARTCSPCILFFDEVHLKKNIPDLFKKAYQTAPSIVFINEIDFIASEREDSQTRRIVAQLKTCMDDFYEQTLRAVDADKETESSERKPGHVLVIGATNRLDAVDKALRMQFSIEIFLGLPNEKARIQILSVLTRNLRHEENINLFKIASSTPGFVGADLEALVKEAVNLALSRIIDRRGLEFSSKHKDKNTGGGNHGHLTI